MREEFFTGVELAFYPEYRNFWLRFGVPDAELALDRRRRLAFFKPGHVLGYVRWSANDYGTQAWRFTIVRTVRPPVVVERIQGVYPGGETLLTTSGKTRIKRALVQVDALEEGGFEASAVSPAYFRHMHNRIAVGQTVRAYRAAQHEAALAARQLAR